MLRAKKGAPIPSPFVVSLLDLQLSPSKSLGVRQLCMDRKNAEYKKNKFERFVLCENYNAIEM
jgi:hypothetical protein